MKYVCNGPVQGASDVWSSVICQRWEEKRYSQRTPHGQADVVASRVSGGIMTFDVETLGEGRAEVRQHTERCSNRSPGQSLGIMRVYKTYRMITWCTISCSPLIAQADGLDPSSQTARVGTTGTWSTNVPRGQAQIDGKRVSD